MSFVVGGYPEEREIVHVPIRDLQAQGVVFTGAAGNVAKRQAYDPAICVTITATNCEFNPAEIDGSSNETA
jgi:hypothetical protein